MIADKKQIQIDYTNHAGIRQFRQILPLRLWWGSTEWHPEEQWILNAFDVGKSAIRSFAVRDINRWNVKPDVVDVSIVKQLQASMERNARMSNRLKRVEKLLSGIDGELPTHASEIDTALNRILWGNRAIESILKDEEPTWPTK